MFTASFQRFLEQELQKKAGKKTHIRRVQPMSGGSINNSCKLDTTAGYFFLKMNDAFSFPNMFLKEKNGLEHLRSTGIFTIPEVILQSDFEDQSFLLMQFISPGVVRDSFWEMFGSRLAELHRFSDSSFGWDEDNYIGSLVQVNRRHKKWIDFFITERIEVQLKLALDSGKMEEKDHVAFKRLFTQLDELMPTEVPALLHGDLWSGNYLVDEKGHPCLIDPAIYFGHREMDLSMTHLFGGFEPQFYQSYQTSYPLQPGYERRMDLYNLYPLLVHLNLFGGSYLHQLRSIIKQYV